MSNKTGEITDSSLPNVRFSSLCLFVDTPNIFRLIKSERIDQLLERNMLMKHCISLRNFTELSDRHKKTHVADPKQHDVLHKSFVLENIPVQLRELFYFRDISLSLSV